MKNIYLISDLHFNHDKEFIWKARGFNSVEEMNESIVQSFNEIVHEDDIVYILGDLMMGFLTEEKWLPQLNGEIHYIIGNHDTANRLKYYEELGFICEGYATVIQYKHHSFYLSHYPTLVQNTTMTESTFTLEIINAAPALRTFTLQDANYENLNIDTGSITLS